MNLIFFFICVTTFPLISNAKQARDSNGDFVVPGNSYYIVSVLRGAGGGGLNLSSFIPTADQCPDTVTQESSDLALGLPCTFFPANPADTTIRLKSSLNIAFTNISKICPNTTTVPWQVGQTRILKTGGTIGNPGCLTVANWFRIGKGSYKWSYRLLYDPSDVCKTLMGTYHLGVRDVLGKRVLAVSSSGDPIEFVFIKVPAPAAVQGRSDA